MSDDAFERIKGLNGFQLSRLAGCGVPDGANSAGGRFLASVRDDVIDKLSFYLTHASDPDVSAPCWREVQDEIADGAPDVMSAERWREFVDLAAWQETPEKTEGWMASTLTDIAAEALSQIAYRLAGELMTCDDTGEIVTECDRCDEHGAETERG